MSLALVSQSVDGVRLASLIGRTRGPAVALEFLQQLLPTLAKLQDFSRGISHGLITPDRIVVTPVGDLVLTEYVLASAVESLGLPSARLRATFDLVGPTEHGVLRLDARTDVAQLAFVAVQLIVGRRLPAMVYPALAPALLEECSAVAVQDPQQLAGLTSWLAQALAISDKSFQSAGEAYQELRHVLDDCSPHLTDGSRAFSGAAGDARVVALPAPPPTAVSTPMAADSLPTPPTPEPPFEQPEETDFPSEIDTPAVWGKPVSVPPRTPFSSSAPSAPARAAVTEPNDLEAFPTDAQTDRHTDRSKPTPAVSRIGLPLWAVAILIGAVLAQGAVITAILLRSPRQSAAPPATPAAQVTPAQPAVTSPAPGATTAAASTTNSPASAGESAAKPPAAAQVTAPAPPAVPRELGAVKLTTSFPVQVFEGKTLVGSSAGPFALPVGEHTINFVNEELTYTKTQHLTVAPNQTITVTLTAPIGHVSINASPWADVTIDGVAAGQTPLANLAVPIGEHQVVFRHPQLGERTQTMVVKTEGLTLVSANLQR